jgi:putative MATE family efflux protein
MADLPDHSRRPPLFGPAGFYREALGIVVPVMLQSLITSLVSLVDNFMVAGLGDAKMAAVNVANQLNFVYLIVVNTACIAGGIYLSQHRGAGDAEGMRQAFRFKIIASLTITLAYMALCLAAPEALLRLMLGGNRANAEIVVEGARFLRAVTPSFLPFALAASFGSAYRETGETKVPLIISSSAAALCTFLNWVLIYGQLGAPRMEVTGAALATDIARLVEAGAFLAWTARRKPAFAFSPRRLFAVDRGVFGSILGRSGMMFFSETAWVISETIITALYNRRGGAETVAGMAAGWTIANLFFLVFGAIHTATAVIVGSTLGAGRLEEARLRARWIMSGSVLFGAAVGLVAAAATAIIPLVFANLSPEARLVTRGLVLVIALYLPLWTLLNAQFAVSRAGGDTAMGLWVDVGVTYAIFVPAAWILAAATPVGPVALFGLAKLCDFPKALVAQWWLRKGRWVRNLAERPPSAR